MTLSEWQIRLEEWLEGMDCPKYEEVHNLVWALSRDDTLMTGLIDLVNQDRNDYHFALEDDNRAS
jgi:hypothetical protein